MKACLWLPSLFISPLLWSQIWLFSKLNWPWWIKKNSLGYPVNRVDVLAQGSCLAKNILTDNAVWGEVLSSWRTNELNFPQIRLTSSYPFTKSSQHLNVVLLVYSLTFRYPNTIQRTVKRKQSTEYPNRCKKNYQCFELWFTHLTFYGCGELRSSNLSIGTLFQDCM